MVKFWEDGRWTCDDLGWRFQKGPKRDCKHIVEAEKGLGLHGANRVSFDYLDDPRDKNMRFIATKSIDKKRGKNKQKTKPAPKNSRSKK